MTPTEAIVALVGAPPGAIPGQENRGWRRSYQPSPNVGATPVATHYRVTLADGRDAMLRMDQPLARALGLDRHAELTALRAAHAAGLGPAVIAAAPDRGLLLTTWLPGRAWTPGDLADPPNLRAAVLLLRRVHALAVPVPVQDLPGAVDRYARLAGAAPCGSGASRDRALRRSHKRRSHKRRSPSVGAAPAAISAQAEEARARLAEAEALGGGRCFCHGDPGAANFIGAGTGALHLIDWEYAGLSSPWLDLAALQVHNGLPVDAAEAILAAYLDRPAEAGERARLRAWGRLYGLLAGLWEAAVVVGAPPCGSAARRDPGKA